MKDYQFFCLGGNYVVQFLDKFSTAPALMLVVMMEAIAASWVSCSSTKDLKNSRLFSSFSKVYGIDNLVVDIRNNLGFEPNRFFRLAWTVLCPVIVILLMVLSFTYSDELKYADYVFPSWSIILGWCMNMCFILPIPITMFYALIFQSDSRSSLKERFRLLFVPTVTKRKLKQQIENGTEYNMSSASPIAYV